MGEALTPGAGIQYFNRMRAIGLSLLFYVKNNIKEAFSPQSGQDEYN